MATISYDININPGNSVKTLGQLEGELESINSALKLVKPGSEAFDELTKSAQKTNKEITKINNEIQGFTAEDKIRTLDGAIKTFGGSVQAVVGSLGLLGIESEQFAKFEKYAASAIAFGIGIKDLGEGVTQLAVGFKKSGIAAELFGKISKKALIATGIGAFVVALGTVVAYWDEIVEYVSGADDALVKYNEELELSKSASQSIVGVLESEIALINAKGGDTEAVNKKLREQLALQIKITNEQITQKQLQLQETQEENAQLTFWEKLRVGVLQAVGAYQSAGSALADSLNPESEETRALNEEINKLMIERNGLEAKQVVLNETIATQEAMKAGNLEMVQVKTIGIVDTTQKYNDQLQIQTTALDDNTAKRLINTAEQNLANATVANAENIEMARTEALYASGQALQSLGSILNQESAAAKGLAISSALINTYLGVTEVLKQKSTLPSPFDVITKVANVATILATGFKAIQGIKSTSTKGGGSGSRISVQQPSRGESAIPQTPVARTLTQGLDAAEVQTQQATPIVQAYVLEGTVTSAQEASAKIRQRRTVGR